MTFKEWLIKELGPDEDSAGEPWGLEDLATHGAASGFPGLTYYTDTCALYDKYTEELWAVLRDITENWDGSSILEMLADCPASKAIECDTTFKNFIVWAVAEHYAAEYLNREDRNDE